MAYLQTEIISHTRRVCSLYKNAARLMQAWSPDRIAFRYNVTLLRAQFEANKKIIDGAQVQKLIEDGENQLFEKQHYQPIKFPYSPGGVAFERELRSPDWVLDFWSEEEKAKYPEYFAKREQLKKEYVNYWEKKFGQKAENPHHH